MTQLALPILINHMHTAVMQQNIFVYWLNKIQIVCSDLKCPK